MAGDLWEKLTARCMDRHRHLERTLRLLAEVQGAMGELGTALDQAEGVRDAWEPVGDLFIDTLQDHIDATKVRCLKASKDIALLPLSPKGFYIRRKQK